MSKTSSKSDRLAIPVLKRAQLGAGVRRMDFKQYSAGTNVVVLRPEIFAAFPSSEAVNSALGALLAVAIEARPRKRAVRRASSRSRD